VRRIAGFRNLIDLLPRRPQTAPTYSTSDLAAVALLAAAVAVWIEMVDGRFSFLAFGACLAVLGSFYLTGSLLAAWRPLAMNVAFDLPLRLLLGYAVVNTTLLVLAFLSPFGIVANFGVLLAIVSALFVAGRPVRAQDNDGLVGLLVVGLSLVAATLWCQDTLHPISVQENLVVFKPWIDSFYHAVHIRIFGAGHGWASIEDFRLAGVPARLYHYGVYLTPALVKQASGIHSYTAFAGILAPLGVFFTGLGAYALVGSFWGAWPGLGAAMALLLLPDGAQQGMRNTFMSYHWLTQISPSATYGLAILAAAWLFVVRGCLQGNRLQLGAGWLLAGVLAVYKLHFFIASALLLWLVPPLFFRGGLPRARRAAWLLGALGAYAVAVVYLQRLPGIPLLRFDGSCVGKIMDLVKSFAPPGRLRELLDLRTGAQRSGWSNLLAGVPFVLLAVLGGFLPALLPVAVWLRKRTPTLIALFPFLLTSNFLAMFFGLALDFQSSTPDELSHRPLMVMYFGVVTWAGGATVLALVSSRRLARMARPALLGLAVLLLAVPAHFGTGVHRIWAMRRFAPVRVPIGLVRAAEYLRDHGGARDVFQDSQFDRVYTVAALSERRAFAAHTLTRMPYNHERIEEREVAVEHLMQLREVAAIATTARELGLQWFLLDPSDRVAWPDELKSRPAFEMNGYRLYRF
jgi:hypothetical protein